MNQVAGLEPGHFASASINGPMAQVKARLFVMAMGLKNFAASSGWLDQIGQGLI